MIEAVTFDFWNTLVVDEPRGMRPLQIAGWTEVLERAGIEVHADALVEAFDAAWETFDNSWTSNRQFQTDGRGGLHPDRVGTDASAGVRAELVEVYSRVGATSPLDVTPNAEATLRRLRERGVRLGVICDVGMTASTALLGRLEGFGLAELFDHFSWSDEVGVYKPDGRMFRDAFDGTRPLRPRHARPHRRSPADRRRGRSRLRLGLRPVHGGVGRPARVRSPRPTT